MPSAQAESAAVPSTPPPDLPARPNIVMPVLLGCLVTFVFFGGFIAWSSFAKLSSAAIAPGSVTVEANRKTIQHLEGGIVRRILVVEGQKVEKNDPLIELDQTKVQSRVSLLQGQIEANKRQLKLLDEEIASVEKLLKDGLAAKPRLLGLQRREAEVSGELNRLSAQLLDAEDGMKRSVIRATIDGTVVGLSVHSPGGVIAAGERLMDIVPRDARLIIEANVDPNDIDIIHAGLRAMVYLTAFNQRSSIPINARVTSVSADHMTDNRTGQTFFLAQVELTEDPADVFPGASLYPGMPAEVMIVTGDTTLLDFLLQPVIRSFTRAFRET